MYKGFRSLTVLSVLAGFVAQQAMATDIRFTGGTDDSWSNSNNWNNTPPVSEEGGDPDHFIRVVSPLRFDGASDFIWDGRLLQESDITIDKNELHVRQTDYLNGDDINLMCRTANDALNIGGTGVLKFSSPRTTLPGKGADTTTTISGGGQLIFDGVPWTVGLNANSFVLTLKGAGKLTLINGASICKMGSYTDEIDQASEVETNKYVSFDTNTINTSTFRIAGKDKAYFEDLVDWGFIRVNDAVVLKADFDANFTYDSLLDSISLRQLLATDDLFLAVTGVSMSGNVLDNDLLSPGDTIVNTSPSHGSFSIDTTTGLFTYTSAVDYSGVDTFTYYII